MHAAADRVLVVATKADLPSAEWPPDLPCDLRVSAVSGDAGELRQRFGHRLAALRALPGAGPVGGTAALSRAQLGTLQLMAQD